MTDKKILIVLSCLHTAMFQRPAPAAGERLWCMRCGGYKEVWEAPPNYVVQCKRCSYFREFGDAIITAETAAGRHARRHPSHTVQLLDGDEQLCVYVNNPLPTNVPLPPF
jgi:hypothetical protein